METEFDADGVLAVMIWMLSAGVAFGIEAQHDRLVMSIAYDAGELGRRRAIFQPAISTEGPERTKDVAVAFGSSLAVLQRAFEMELQRGDLNVIMPGCFTPGCDNLIPAEMLGELLRLQRQPGAAAAVVAPSGWMRARLGGLYCPKCAPATPVCHLCGCTQEVGCPEGCSWALILSDKPHASICSVCTSKLQEELIAAPAGSLVALGDLIERAARRGLPQ